MNRFSISTITLSLAGLFLLWGAASHAFRTDAVTLLALVGVFAMLAESKFPFLSVAPRNEQQ